MNKNSNKAIGITIHILIWVGLLSLPYLISFFTNPETIRFDARSLIMPLQIMGLFYLNFFFLINKLLFKRHVWQFISINAFIMAVLAAALLILFPLLFPEHRPHPDSDVEGFRRFDAVIVNVIVTTLTVGLSVAIKMTGKWYEERGRVQVLEKANAEAELQQLKSQLNPHFLFNSLNNIYALIGFNPEKAQFSLTSLCDMLRYQLYEANRETIPLEKEIEFINSYCDLMRLRLPKHVTLDVELPQETTGITLAPLLFVSIIENAFKHGISQNNPSHIGIRITVDKGLITCIVKNSYYPKRDNDRSGSGIGLENLRRRLALLYPASHIFTAEKKGDEFVARLILNTNP